MELYGFMKNEVRGFERKWCVLERKGSRLCFVFLWLQPIAQQPHEGVVIKFLLSIAYMNMTLCENCAQTRIYGQAHGFYAAAHAMRG